MAAMSLVDLNFQALMDRMQLQSADIASYLQGFAQQRKWMMPPISDDDSDDGWDGDLSNIEGIAKAFDRTEAGGAYKGTLHGGTSGTCSAHNMEVAYMSMMERSFRARHKTPCRSIAHAAGRRRGHGDPGGIHKGQILQFIQDLLVSGGEVTVV